MIWNGVEESPTCSANVQRYGIINNYHQQALNCVLRESRWLRQKRARSSWIIPSTGDHNHNWELRRQCWLSSLYEHVMRMLTPGSLTALPMRHLTTSLLSSPPTGILFYWITWWVFYHSPLPSSNLSPLSLFGPCRKLEHAPCQDFHHFTWPCFRNETLECHAFLCPKRKMAQAATLTIAQVLCFELSFQCNSLQYLKWSSCVM